MILNVNSIKPQIRESHTNETSEISVDSVDSISTANELVSINNESSYINSSGNSINSDEYSTQTFLETPISNLVREIYLVCNKHGPKTKHQYSTQTQIRY